MEGKKFMKEGLKERSSCRKDGKEAGRMVYVSV